MSDDGSGPLLIGQNETFRIEGFIDGRPLTIWELRNPIIQLEYAQVICHFNFDSNMQKKLSEFCDLDTNKLVIHEAIDVWAPACMKRIEMMKAQLRESGKKDIIQIVERMERTMLFEGYNQHYRALVPIPEDQENAIFPTVFAHNDIQELNMMCKNEDNTKIVLIDFEYGVWNPMAMDLANYINECMIDNSYPKNFGKGFYEANAMSKQEIEAMARAYLKVYFNSYMKAELKLKYQNSCYEFLEKE